MYFNFSPFSTCNCLEFHFHPLGPLNFISSLSFYNSLNMSCVSLYSWAIHWSMVNLSGMMSTDSFPQQTLIAPQWGYEFSSCCNSVWLNLMQVFCREPQLIRFWMQRTFQSPQGSGHVHSIFPFLRYFTQWNCFWLHISCQRYFVYFYSPLTTDWCISFLFLCICWPQWQTLYLSHFEWCWKEDANAGSLYDTSFISLFIKMESFLDHTDLHYWVPELKLLFKM